MKKSSLLLIFCLITLAIINAACAKTPPPATTEAPDAAYTASIQTIVAGLTQSAPTLMNLQGQSGEVTQLPTVELPIPSEFVNTDTPLPTLTPQPSATLDFSPTPSPTDTIEPSATLEPTETATETPLPVLIFQDKFTSKAGWTKETREDFGFDFVDGGYQIFVKIVDVPIWSVRTNTYPDVQLEVDTLDTGKVKGGYWGLICRHTGGAQFYALVVGSDGFYGIAKKGSGKFTFLKQGNAPPEANITPDENIHVRADCIGETLSLYANGVLLTEVRDKEYTQGDVGMVVGARGWGKVIVLFDNFVVYSPKE